MTGTATHRATAHFEIRKDDLRKTRFFEELIPGDGGLAAGQVLLSIDRFAMTANNVTYAVIGDSFGYFRFFPAAEEGWARVPAWGFGTVVATRNEGIKLGERFYGYYPMSTHLRVTPAESAGGFVDVTEHRRALPSIYNRYERATAQTDASADADGEARRSLFQPLFGTAFLLDDWLASNSFFGAEQVVLTSASSKTAFSLAALLSRRAAGRPKIIGLTSAKNQGFVQRIGVYDEVVLYDSVRSLPEAGTVSVDMAGSQPLLQSIHERLATNLKYSCRVGAAHWESRPDLTAAPNWPGPAPQLFFAPSHGEARAKEWGPAEFQKRVKTSFLQFLQDTKGGFVEVQETHGRNSVESAYRQTLEGEVPPSLGVVVGLE